MNPIARFFFEAGMLKKMRRTGYPFLGSGGESVADHCFRAGLIGYTLALLEEDCDAPRVALMMMAHDQTDATISRSITSFTVKVARRNRPKKEKSISAAAESASVSITLPLYRRLFGPLFCTKISLRKGRWLSKPRHRQVS